MGSRECWLSSHHSVLPNGRRTPEAIRQSIHMAFLMCGWPRKAVESPKRSEDEFRMADPDGELRDLCSGQKVTLGDLGDLCCTDFQRGKYTGTLGSAPYTLRSCVIRELQAQSQEGYRPPPKGRSLTIHSRFANLIRLAVRKRTLPRDLRVSHRVIVHWEPQP